jgi:hypothetical protein
VQCVEFTDLKNSAQLLSNMLEEKLLVGMILTIAYFLIPESWFQE